MNRRIFVFGLFQAMWLDRVELPLSPLPGDDPPVSSSVIEHKKKKEESNLCTRHKMHKHFIMGGRSWRCRR
jgi:hypothetical protein